MDQVKEQGQQKDNSQENSQDKVQVKAQDTASPILTYISELYNDPSVINHILQYYKGKHRDYLHEVELYDNVLDVLTNVITYLERIPQNRIRTKHCIYWPYNFEVGHAVPGSSGLGTFQTQDYTDEIVSKHKSAFYGITINTSRISFDQFHHDIFKLFYHW